MIELLKVNGIRSAHRGPVVLEFDEYIPLQFRTYQEPLGAGYLRLGNDSTSLLELAVEPFSQVLSGATVVSLDQLSPWPSFQVAGDAEGLPVLSTDFEDWKVIDLKRNFMASVRPGEIILFWDDLSSCEAYVFDGVRCLIRDKMLVALWLVDLPEIQVTQFSAHAQSTFRGG